MRRPTRRARYSTITPVECAVRVECPRCAWRRACVWSRDEVLALPAPVDAALRARAAAWLGVPVTEHHRNELPALAWRVARGVANALEVGHVSRTYAPSWRVRACVTAVRVDVTPIIFATAATRAGLDGASRRKMKAVLPSCAGIAG